MKTISVYNDPKATATIQYLACFRAGKSQYVGESQYQIEALVSGGRVVRFETAKTISEAKRKFEWQYSRYILPRRKTARQRNLLSAKPKSNAGNAGKTNKLKLKG